MNETATPRLRIVRIIDRLNIGGPAKHTVWLTEGLNPKEFETFLITGVVAAGEGDMAYFARAAGIEPIIIKHLSRELSLRDLLVIAQLMRWFWKLKPDIVHTHKSKAGAAGRIAAMLYKWMTLSALWLRPRKCLIVHTYHGHVFHSYYGRLKTGLFIAIERVLARFCTDCIVTVSDQQRLEISGRFAIGRPEQFQVIPLGIDLDEITNRRGSLRRELGISNDEVAIGVVGRLCEVKDHAMLIEAAARLISETSDSSLRVRLVIVGDGHLRDELERLTLQRGIADRVAFLGFRSDATSLYPDFDLVALTSLNEGTPLTLIEAMSCGRAVAATEVGGIVDLMGSHRSFSKGFSVWDHGVTVKSRDVEAFGQALRFLIERPDLRRQMGEHGYTYVRTRLSKDRLVSDIENLYHNLIGNHTTVASATRTVAQSRVGGQG